MAKIYKYQKVIDIHTTYCLVEPNYPMGTDAGRITELCAIDGFTYVSVPDSLVLPQQPEQINVEAVELTEALDTAIRKESVHIQLINQRVVERIRQKYSITDEFKSLRVGPSAETKAYNGYVEECRAWGKAEKEKLLGLPLKEKVVSWLSSKEALTSRIDDAKVVSSK